MILIEYDILFSIRAELVDETGNVSTRISPQSWRFSPTLKTLSEMQRRKFLFKQIGESGLVLAEPQGIIEEAGEKTSIFNFPEPLSFVFQLDLKAPALRGFIDLGPGPREDSETFPEDKKTYFQVAFPGKMPAYFLGIDRLVANRTPTGAMDAVAPPVTRLSFDKKLFSDLTLKGPLPNNDLISPQTLIEIEKGEEVEREDLIQYEFDLRKLIEGLYQIEGKKKISDDLLVEFSGNFFHTQEITSNPPIAYLSIEIPTGQIKATENSFMVRFKEITLNT